MMLNSEKYKTAEERAKEFEIFCSEHICEECPLNEIKPDCGDSRGQFAWLELEAGPGKIDDCPYCGSHCLTRRVSGGTWRVVCKKDISCMYSSGLYKTEHDAIFAHNRVARSVMAADKKEEK